MISRRIILSNYSSSPLQYYPSFFQSPFIFNFNFNSNSNNDSTHQIRHYSSKPRFDFGRIRKGNDAVVLFRQMQRAQPLPSVFDFTKLLNSVVKIKQYDVALYLFNKMLQRDLPVNLFTFSIAMNCFRHLRLSDYGFAVLGSIFKRGYEPDVVTFSCLIDGLIDSVFCFWKHGEHLRNRQFLHRDFKHRRVSDQCSAEFKLIIQVNEQRRILKLSRLER